MEEIQKNVGLKVPISRVVKWKIQDFFHFLFKNIAQNSLTDAISSKQYFLEEIIGSDRGVAIFVKNTISSVTVTVPADHRYVEVGCMWTYHLLILYVALSFSR